ncbi:electron transport complex subunit RsxC [Pasteurella multocida]|uniref:electron transport complex subunit RsxC n=1 Tax=Pasteurella multocida TaxID=747 RepID=UPI002A4E3F38|nr:electron transport complex subunit RsxC [Pasteurella multocida]MDY0499143.1 electron transport complex subunit RsxC [Pasteurella multocida]WRU40987.1 electron transport complex subunit RsxC [Pasteurella multocida]
MDVLTRFNSGKLWDFKGGVHPPERKSQSNQKPIRHAKLVEHFYIPVVQHAGEAGNILVKVGDYVFKGQPLTQGDGLRVLPVHASTSGFIRAIAPYASAHPSGLATLCLHLEADGKDQWREQHPLDDFLTQTPEKLIEKLYQAGVAGLGGAVFPTAAKLHSAEKQVKLLIINGAECEPYITCDDRLMRDYADEIIEGTRILRYILRPEKVVIAVEDNKPEAVAALRQVLQGANDIEIRVIPTKYPSGAAKQLIQILTGMEVPSGQRSSSIGVLMQNVATAFAVKRAIMDDEPLIERVVTLTGDKVRHKGNYWVRLGTPIYQLLQQVDYHYDDRFPVFMGGPMMGFILPDLQAPVTKMTNCLLAPDHFEYAPPAPEQSCIRCSACSDACPVSLMPQQLYWFARSEDHEKSEEYALKDCIECGLCAYVCPSHIPLIQYFRQEKAKIWEIQQKAKQAEEAKQRFEARQAREEQERKARAQKAMEARRQEMKTAQGIDPVQAALERLKAKKADNDSSAKVEIKTIVTEKGDILPDNSDIMAQRKARRLARQQQTQNTDVSQIETNEENKSTDSKSAVAAAIARAKAKKAAQQGSALEKDEISSSDTLSVGNDTEPVAEDPRKAAIAAAIARAKAKKAAQQGSAVEKDEISSSDTLSVGNDTEPVADDPRKAAIAAAIARAKAKKAAQQGSAVEKDEISSSDTLSVGNDTEPVAEDPRKVAIAAAIARAKAKKAAQQGNALEKDEISSSDTLSVENEAEPVAEDPRKAAIAAAIARAKAKKAAQQRSAVEQDEISSSDTLSVGNEKESVAEDPRKAAIAAAIARAKAKKAAKANNHDA